MKTNQLIVVSSIVVGGFLTLNSCKKTETPTPSSSSTGIVNYSEGSLITNEGSFGNANGSMSYYNSTTDEVINEVFSLENDRPLGDVVQSVTRNGNSTYICVNASNKVEVVNSITFKEEATITDITQARYMVANNNTGYISSWGNGGEVIMIDLTTNSTSGTISVGSGPERMAISNNNLYVANSGGFGSDSTISVVDLSSNTVTSTIDIGAFNPSAIVNGANNTLWILAKGKVIYDATWTVIGHEPAKLIELNTTTNTITSSTELFTDKHPTNVEISLDQSTLYFGGSYGFDGIYSVSTSALAAPSLFINEGNYGFFMNKTNGNLFVLQDASSANGTLFRYNSSGTKLGEYTVGIFPSGGARLK